MTAAERRAWARYTESMEWALKAGGRGDALKARLGLERAWAQLGADLAAANLPPPARRYRPELKLLASTDLPIFIPPAEPANDGCVTCDRTGVLPNGTVCQFCQGTGVYQMGLRLLLVDDVEETTAVEGATLQLPALTDAGQVA